MRTCARYVPGVVKVAVSMDTSTRDTSRYGRTTVPDAADSLSQGMDLPSGAETFAVQSMLPAPMFRIPKFFDSGEPPPATVVNERPVCESRMVRGRVPTVRNTLTLWTSDGLAW